MSANRLALIVTLYVLPDTKSCQFLTYWAVSGSFLAPLGEFAGVAREVPLNLAHKPTTERHDADHEDDADDHRNPGADPVREVLL